MLLYYYYYKIVLLFLKNHNFKLCKILKIFLPLTDLSQNLCKTKKLQKIFFLIDIFYANIQNFSKNIFYMQINIPLGRLLLFLSFLAEFFISVAEADYQSFVGLARHAQTPITGQDKHRGRHQVPDWHSAPASSYSNGQREPKNLPKSPWDRNRGKRVLRIRILNFR